MKATFFTILISLVFVSCNNSSNNTPIPVVNTPAPVPEKTSFFPVTDFLKGQVTEIRSMGVNPVKTTTIKDRQDSVWLKVENLNNEFADFLSPVIDSASVAGNFEEKKFLDQTINAFTFTYDPVKPLPDSFRFQRWDVYVDPETERVSKIYLLKKTADHKTLHLTWQAGKSCKIVTIATDAKGNDFVEKEVVIKWDF